MARVVRLLGAHVVAGWVVEADSAGHRGGVCAVGDELREVMLEEN
jgi:hypothetical protein